MGKDRVTKFKEALLGGRRFEAEERNGWGHIPRGHIAFEARTVWESKAGRVDIKIDEKDGSVAIVEIKATDWDAVKPHRIRPTAQRHARQVWRYVNDHLEVQSKEVCPGVVYEYEPTNPEVQAQVEQVLNERFIQVVWRKGKKPR